MSLRDDAPLYHAPCALCSAGLAESYRSNGRPLILTPHGLRHALVVLEHTARCPWMYHGHRGACETRDRLKAAQASIRGRRVSAKSGVLVEAVRSRDCEVCWPALTAFGEVGLAVLWPSDALHVAQALTNFLTWPLPMKVARSAGVLRLGGFDPMPVEVLDYASAGS